MVGVRKRGEEIRQFILDNVEAHPRDIATVTADKFEISRQAVNKHIQKLVEQHAIEMKGSTRNRLYLLTSLKSWQLSYPLDDAVSEDRIWREDINAFVSELPDNLVSIWHYGVTEMINNAIDHSSGNNLLVQVDRTAVNTEILISDDGEGIFKKIQRELGLLDERHSVLELSKGKLTTDPDNHTGEGIFFTSRMFDEFAILSGNVFFSHQFDKLEDWIMEPQKFQSGTLVHMKINNNTARTTKEVFDKFTADESYGFSKTIVPVKLTQYGDDKLVSRSQAKRLLVRVDRFKTVIFDFNDVESIGQAFADEIFRVFKNQHPNTQLIYWNANKQVGQMISRALTSE